MAVLSKWREEIIGNARLICADCRDVLPTLGMVDAVVTDPPYGVQYEGSVTKDKGKHGKSYISFIDTAENIEAVCVPAIRTAVSKARSAIITPGNANAFKYDEPRSIGAIYYPAGANSGPWGFVCSQILFFYGKDPYLAKALGRLPNAFAATGEPSQNIDHPCPKPIGQMKWLVQRASLAGETVLDPFMGSGTTGVACANLGRKFIGIEIEPKYFDIACRRIEQAYKQPDFFIEKPAPAKQEALDL